MGPAAFPCALAVVALAAATQRVTGLGFALVSGPFLVVAAGPREGVLLANGLSLTTNLLVLAQTWRDVEPQRVAVLAVPALAMIPVGSWVAARLPTGPLTAGIGLMVLASLGAVLALRGRFVLRGTGGAVTAGALSGFMNVTAGVGGPAMTLYALGSAWEHRGFVASMQLYFALLNAASIAAKGPPRLPAPELLALLAALLLGLGAGEVGARRVPPARARQAVVALALAGAAASLVKGLLLT